MSSPPNYSCLTLTALGYGRTSHQGILQKKTQFKLYARDKIKIKLYLYILYFSDGQKVI